MRLRSLSRVVLPALACLLLPASALAAPPANDNYLASLVMAGSDGAISREFSDQPNTSEATVQADLFNPNREGQPFGGGAAENTRCGQTQFGKTVWYDFAPRTDGGVQITAGGFNTVVAVYEYDASNATITRQVTCSDQSATAAEDVLLPTVEGGKSYTVQVGGAGDAGGPLDFKFNFFPDRDGDEVLDEAPDRCPDQQGIDAFGGCPPELRANPRVSWVSDGDGVQFTLFAVERLARGARVELRCRRCGVREVVTARSSTVRLRRLLARRAPSGSVIEVRVTKAATRSGRYRFGAIGNYFRYRVSGGAVGRRVTRCLRPGSTVPRRRCT